MGAMSNEDEEPMTQKPTLGQRARRASKVVFNEPLEQFKEDEPTPEKNDDDPDKAQRDLHDLANLLVLPVVVVSDNTYLHFWCHGAPAGGVEYWIFFCVVLGYFAGDLAWVLMIPKCVKSPPTILVHHIAGITYLAIPFFYPTYGHFLG